MNHRQAARSQNAIVGADLKGLATIACQDRVAFAIKCHDRGYCITNFLCSALCQGAALHFVDHKNGIKDFDVWSFYSVTKAPKFPPRRIVSRDFGNSKFGRSPDRPDFVGRRVDLLGRSLNTVRGTDPIVALRRYLTEASTDSARRLSEKAVVLLEPASKRGTIVWPVLLKEQLSVLAHAAST
jgi:hypothetical protein